MTFPRVIVDGDAVGGWIVDIHDGDKDVVYRPDGATREEAEDAARAEHGLPRIHAAPPAPPVEPPAVSEPAPVAAAANDPAPPAPAA